jgi:hypothetical protein
LSGPFGVLAGLRAVVRVGRILGHTQLATTTRYAHLNQESLLDAANAVGRIAMDTGGQSVRPAVTMGTRQ